ncbi:ankyrin repeat protein [Actinomadura pelletieri DSM 43383]|uniref:Ankyrin repeat protein n=1 Tax=Actinomadura pelletieri DSM 43383 TaxID=1120940 RepID=A0A495QRF1_9ACTN|nr:ankyrin repeat domain-containing protein [Actinomadura pelletieri]RKS76083.1 ankyrin repeat protein [Actinomadura pelletieri DSM 43383]
MAGTAADWSGMYHGDLTDLEKIRQRLDAGADPVGELWGYGTPLHEAAKEGSAEVVSELARRAHDVDALCDNRSALWNAVFHRRADNVSALLEQGADPWRPMMDGWSPGRLGQVGPFDFGAAPEGHRLTEEERGLAESGPELARMLSDLYYDGFSLTCVANVTATEAVRRLDNDGLIVVDGRVPWHDLPFCYELDIIGVTDVPGGCVLAQPWAYRANDFDMIEAVTAGTFAYGMYANPKSGNQGCVAEDGRIPRWDLHPGYDPASDATARDVLAAYASCRKAIVHCMVYAGLRPETADCLEHPDVWLRLGKRTGG